MSLDNILRLSWHGLTAPSPPRPPGRRCGWSRCLAWPWSLRHWPCRAGEARGCGRTRGGRADRGRCARAALRRSGAGLAAGLADRGSALGRRGAAGRRAGAGATGRWPMPWRRPGLARPPGLWRGAGMLPAYGRSPTHWAWRPVCQHAFAGRLWDCGGGSGRRAWSFRPAQPRGLAALAPFIAAEAMLAARVLASTTGRGARGRSAAPTIPGRC